MRIDLARTCPILLLATLLTLSCQGLSGGTTSFDAGGVGEDDQGLAADEGTDTDFVLTDDPDECRLHHNDEAACRAAGCNLVLSANRVCLDSDGNCVVDPAAFELCGLVEPPAYMMNIGDITEAWYDPTTGEVYLMSTPANEAIRPVMCPDPDLPYPGDDVPAACECLTRERIQGECPAG